MKRKLLSLALVVAMLASMLVIAPTAGATEAAATVEITDAVGFAGDTVTVNVVVTTETMAGYTFLVEYDRTRLELVKSNTGANAVTPDEGVIVGEVDNGDTSYELMNGCGNGVVTNAAGEIVKDADGNPLAPTFASIVWSDANGAPQDCSNGEVAAILTFNIKEGALPGDAYVSIDYLCGTAIGSNGKTEIENYSPQSINNGKGTSYRAEGEIAFSAGKVTVLPEGYISTVVDEADFTIEGGVLKKYNGTSTGTVVIPSTVTEIATNAMNGSAATAVIIPASVTKINFGAIVNCMSLSSVYILGNDVELAVGAVGCNGSFTTDRSGKVTGWSSGPYADVLEGDNYIVITTIYGAAGSSAETYAALEYDGGATLGWEADPMRTLTFANASYYVSANTVAPGQAINGDKTVVAWKNGDTVVAPGAAMTLTEDTVLTPVEITTPVLNQGFGLKITGEYETTAMRFTTNMLVADYNTLADLGTVTMGTIITPAKYVERAGAFTKEALNKLNTTNKYIDVEATGYFDIDDENTVYTFAGSVRNFKKANADVEYAAAFYLTVELADGTSFTVYSAYAHNNNRNLNDAIDLALAAGAIDDAQAGWLLGQLNPDEE